MDALSKAILAFFDLVEAESALFRARLIEAFHQMLLTLLAGIGLLAGLVFVLIEVHRALTTNLAAPWPSLLVAAICFALGGGMLWHVRRMKS